MYLGCDNTNISYMFISTLPTVMVYLIKYIMTKLQNYYSVNLHLRRGNLTFLQLYAWGAFTNDVI